MAFSVSAREVRRRINNNVERDNLSSRIHRLLPVLLLRHPRTEDTLLVSLRESRDLHTCDDFTFCLIHIRHSRRCTYTNHSYTVAPAGCEAGNWQFEIERERERREREQFVRSSACPSLSFSLLGLSYILSPRSSTIKIVPL